MKFSFTRVMLATFMLVSALFGGTTGKLAGIVKDKKTGETLVGATVVVKSLKPALGAITDKDGYYYILNLPPGRHEVTLKYIGYSTETHIVFINVDQTTTLNAQLSAEQLQTGEVVVTGEREVVRRDQSSTIQKAYAEDLATLPVSTITDVLQLQTGVVNTGALHIRGGRAGEVGYYVDGYRVEDPLFNNATAQVNTQAIQEMELLSGTFNAEYGNSLSGVVNIVTKETAEKYRGNISYKRTNIGISNAGKDLNERVFEGTVSGPLWPESPVGFMLSGKKSDEDNYYYSGNTQKTTAGTESIEFSKNKPYGFSDQLTLVGKLSWVPLGSAKVTLLDNYSKREWRNYDHIMRFIPDSTYLNNSESNLIGVNFRQVLSDDFIYDIRLAYYKYRYLRTVNGFSPSQYTFPTYSTFANSLFYRTMASTVYEDQITKTYTAKGDITWQMNRYHLVKGGVEFKANDLNYYYIANPANPNDQTRNIYNKKPNDGAAYVQDKIEFETIILNLGLRFDFFTANTSFPADPLNKTKTAETETMTSLSPRVGISYPVKENVVFHFSYGQFFQKPEYQTLYNNLERVFSNRSITLFGSPQLKPEKTTSYELGIMAIFDKSTTAQVTFFSKKIQNLIGVAWNYSPLAYAYYVNEDFASVKGFESSVKFGVRNFSLTANYTFSVANGSSSTQQERYSNVYNIVGRQSLRFLPLDFDQRHTANMQLVCFFGKDEGPWDFLPSVFERSSVSIVGQYGSGLPYTFNPARALYVAEPNNSRLPQMLTFDLYARKDFPVGPILLGIYVDVRNLLDKSNILSVYSATGLPDKTGDQTNRATADFMKDPTNYSAPRTMYLGIDIGF